MVTLSHMFNVLLVLIHACTDFLICQVWQEFLVSLNFLTSLFLPSFAVFPNLVYL